jgi:sigma-E factor negative regulatory protein RseB
MMKLRLIGLLFLALPLQQAHAEQDSWLENSKNWVQQLWRDDAKQWLERINSAVVNNNYKGVMVFAQGTSVESFSVDHQMNNGQETLRLRTLSGAPKELLKKGGKFQTNAQTNTQTKQVQFSSALSAEQTSFSQFANAAENKWYKVSLAEKSRVAERPVQVVEIKAQDKFRYSYRLWLDEQTGLPLRVVTLDENKLVIEQVVFTQIQISASKQQIVPAKTPKQKALENPYKDIKGFKLIAKDVKGNSQHLLYSDGLSSVSLYVEPSVLIQKAQMKKDAMNGLLLSNGTTRFVALGKVPVVTLEKFLSAHSTNR